MFCPFFRLFCHLCAFGFLFQVMLSPIFASNPAKLTGKNVEFKEEKPLIPYGLHFQTSAPNALLIDLSTGQVLLEKKARTRMHPSSMTKILTLYVLFQDLEKKMISLDDQITISPYASKQEGTRMWLAVGSKVTIENLLKGIVVASGNDACVAVAEALSGSEENFAHRMNQTAHDLGVRHSHFTNASGLPDENHFSTCWDLALIAQATLKNFPEAYKKYYGLQAYTYQNQTQKNKNVLLEGGFADGMKTGYTKLGGRGIVASAVRSGRRLLLVINGMSTEEAREREAKKILNWGFDQFQSINLFHSGDAVKKIPTSDGSFIDLITEKQVAISIPKHLICDTKVIIKHYNKAPLPVEKGKVLGYIAIQLPHDKMPLRTSLIAKENRYKKSFWQKIGPWIGIKEQGIAGSNDPIKKNIDDILPQKS